jgi:hypothetical protein
LELDNETCPAPFDLAGFAIGIEWSTLQQSDEDVTVPDPEVNP